MTKDHNPDIPKEKARIEAAGGFVKPAAQDGFSARVYLNPEFTQVGLAMARSLGDHCVKDAGVIAEPTVNVYELDATKDAFFILASDGIWEFLSSEYAVDLAAGVLANGGDATAACRELILEAAAKWNDEEEGDYRDDITRGARVWLCSGLQEDGTGSPTLQKSSETGFVSPSAVDARRCMIARINPLDATDSGTAFLPAAADEDAVHRRAGERQRTTNRRVGPGRTTVVLDTKGTGVADTVGVDTTGNGIADTFYPATAATAEGDLAVNTNEPRKASNVLGGQEGARESQKAAFERKRDMIAALVAKVDEADSDEEDEPDFLDDEDA